MEAQTQISTFQGFVETHYQTELLENNRKGINHLLVDFSLLGKHSVELADDLLDNPEEVVRAGEMAIEQMDLPTKPKNFKLRFRNLPQEQFMMVRNLRSLHLGKLLYMEGVVRQKSDVRPQTTSARFECPSCGNIINVLQNDQKFKEPSKCGCGRKGKFRLLSKELIDAQGITLEESTEQLEGGEQPKRLNIFLKEDLVAPLSDKKTNPGSKIRVIGILKEIPKFNRAGTQITQFDLLFEANYVEPIDETFSEMIISKEEEAEIKALAANPKIYSMLTNSLAPSIHGYEKIKEALVLQLAGGVKKERTDGVITRGDMHILLIGDPGAGKSALMKRIAKIAPKARYVSGKGASSAGMTAAVVKDEFLGGWALEAGALPLCNKGQCMIDEMDKMTPEDQSALHEALEQQTISIAKANIQATLRCETTVLAAANPKFGRFDPYGILAQQIDMPPTLISRFDLIFPIKDLPDKEKDEKMASHILALHQSPEGEKTDIPTPLLKKYLAYIRQHGRPALRDDALEEIKNYYVEMRNNSGTEEGGIKAVPITARQLEALVRLAEASAKVRLAAEVTVSDAKRGIDLLHYCLTLIGIDPETGKIDIDRITTGIATSERSKIISVKEIIAEIEKSLGKTIPIEDIEKEAQAKGIDREKVEEALEKLKRAGDIFEPRKGFISRM